MVDVGGAEEGGEEDFLGLGLGLILVLWLSGFLAGGGVVLDGAGRGRGQEGELEG